MKGFNFRCFEFYTPIFCSVFFRFFAAHKNPFSHESIKRKAIFIHIPKNAGRSICASVFGEEGKHVQIKRYYLYDSKMASEFFKFAVVRDPVDRFVSAFNGLKGSADGDGEYDIFVQENIEPFLDVSEFVDWMRESDSNVRKVLRWVHFYPQYKWISINGAGSAVDSLLKFETLHSEWPDFARKMGFPLALSFVGKGRSNQTYLSSDQIDFLRRVYKKDCDLFSY